MNEKKIDKRDYLKIAKIICLITPTVLSLIILIIVGSIIFGRYFSPYSLENRLIIVENMGSSMLSIIGIAVTAWVGLNIYNAIERKEVEKLREDLSILNKSLEEWKTNSEQELFNYMKNNLEETDFLNTKFNDFFNEKEELKELIKRDYLLLTLIGQSLNKGELDCKNEGVLKNGITFEKEYLKDIIEKASRQIYDIKITELYNDKIFENIALYTSFSQMTYNWEREVDNQEEKEMAEEIKNGYDEVKIKNEFVDKTTRKILENNS